ncbi:hypothetical protein ACNFR7_04055 [Streptomyces sp. RM1]|uniref:hypothetical protein n=1 Tax=Streptomyces misionensis TaxID=67331 RepID=UPI00396C09AC
MYLVHARLLPGPGAVLPADAAVLVQQCAGPVDGVEFVVCHPAAPGGPVLGLFLLAPSLAEAEQAAERVCRRALSRHVPLRAFALLACGAVMAPAYYEKLLEESGDPPR